MRGEDSAYRRWSLDPDAHPPLLESASCSTFVPVPSASSLSSTSLSSKSLSIKSTVSFAAESVCVPATVRRAPGALTSGVGAAGSGVCGGDVGAGSMISIEEEKSEASQLYLYCGTLSSGLNSILLTFAPRSGALGAWAAGKAVRQQ